MFIEINVREPLIQKLINEHLKDSQPVQDKIEALIRLGEQLTVYMNNGKRLILVTKDDPKFERSSGYFTYEDFKPV